MFFYCDASYPSHFIPTPENFPSIVFIVNLNP